MIRAARPAILAAALSLAACVQNQDIFVWGTYDQSLLDYYEESANGDKLVAELERLSISYDDSAVPELGEVLSRASSENRETRRKALMEAVDAFKPMDVGKVRLAPGLKAELGYLYMQAGAPDKAVALFQREKRTWPESAYFMDVMIRVAEGPKKDGTAESKVIEAEAARLRAAEQAREKTKK
jgi:hypothetical protein